MKFKIGDRVVHDFPNWHGEIIKATKNFKFFGRYYNVYTIVWDGGVENERIEEGHLTLEEKKQMTKSDLKSGQKVIFKDGSEFVYLPYIDARFDLFSLEDSNIFKLRDLGDVYSVDACDYNSCDIVSVWECGWDSRYLLYKPKWIKWLCVWNIRVEEKKVIKEITIKDIEEKLGYKVKIVDKI